MRKFFSRSMLVVIVLSMISIPVWAERGIKVNTTRNALVIGNSAYASAPLRNPLNDAHAVGGALEKLGFTVTLRTDADQRTMEEEIRAFGRTLRAGGVGLFYYAGHGVQVSGNNYLIPIDARIESESDIKYEAVDAGRVLGKMEDAGNGLNIIILDACRDNPFTRSFRSNKKGLAKMDAPTGSIIVYSTAPGSVAEDGKGRNGLYTEKLLKHMMKKGVPIERVLKDVRVEVMNVTKNRQVPWESSSLTGDFYFNPGKLASIGPGYSALDTRPQSAAQRAYCSLSILPWNLENVADSYKYNFMAQIMSTIDDDRRYQVEYSYYPLDEYYEVQSINRNLISEERLRGVWKKASVFSKIKPDIKSMRQIGTELGVDAIITGELDISAHPYGDYVKRTNVYVIDVASGKVYSESEINSQGVYSGLNLHVDLVLQKLMKEHWHSSRRKP